VLFIVLGVVLVAVGVYYWVTPAGSLLSMVPGYEAGSLHHHVKHGVLALVLGLLCFLGAWMTSGKQPTAA
jgi:hypothetical protein